MAGSTVFCHHITPCCSEAAHEVFFDFLVSLESLSLQLPFATIKWKNNSCNSKRQVHQVRGATEHIWSCQGARTCCKSSFSQLHGSLYAEERFSGSMRLQAKCCDLPKQHHVDFSKVTYSHTTSLSAHMLWNDLMSSLFLALRPAILATLCSLCDSLDPSQNKDSSFHCALGASGSKTYCRRLDCMQENWCPDSSLMAVRMSIL